MDIILKKINELTPYERNPRNNSKAIDAVAASIKNFGFKVPIVIDKDGVIVAGHTRLAAAKKLKLDEVPCIVADDLSDEQINAFRLADNKTAELATWDPELLEIELSDISTIDMKAFGFDEFTNAEDVDPEIIEDEIPDVPEEPVCKLGDLWELGGIGLYAAILLMLLSLIGLWME